MEFVSDNAKGGEWSCMNRKAESNSDTEEIPCIGKNDAVRVASAICKWEPLATYGCAACWLGDAQQA